MSVWGGGIDEGDSRGSEAGNRSAWGRVRRGGGRGVADLAAPLLGASLGLAVDFVRPDGVDEGRDGRKGLLQLTHLAGRRELKHHVDDLKRQQQRDEEQQQEDQETAT